MLPKPRPHLLDRREAKRDLAAIDRAERAKCRQRSGGRCEAVHHYEAGVVRLSAWTVRCQNRATENHHLIGGIGRRNKGRSILAKHRLDVCHRCHQEITNHVLVPVDGTRKEDAATVRYERVR